MHGQDVCYLLQTLLRQLEYQSCDGSKKCAREKISGSLPNVPVTGTKVQREQNKRHFSVKYLLEEIIIA